MRYSKLKLIAKNVSLVCVSVISVLCLRDYLSSSEDSFLSYEDIYVPSPTLPPTLHQRVSTEFTIFGKIPLEAKYKMSEYVPGENSAPLQYSIKTLLTILNKEFDESSIVNLTDIHNIKEPKFRIGQANKVFYAPGSRHVGDVFPVAQSRHTLILTTWRSGSTFLGDLLNQYPGTFYYFEPLHYYANNPNANRSQDEVQFLDSLFKCRFDMANFGYLQHVATWANSFLVKNHNFRLWSSCRSVLPLHTMCFMPEYLSFACNLHPIKLIKTVRMRMKTIEPLLADPSFNLKVILLVRDPRAVFNSRSETLVSNWCTEPSCASPVNECRDLLEDVTSAKQLYLKYPDKVHLIRFEDLGLNPYQTVRQILSFLDLPWSQRLDKFISTHTMIDHSDSDPMEKSYGTSRNSSAVAFAWKQSMALSNISAIQEVCSQPMKMLGYRLIDGETDRKHFTLLKTARETWPLEE